MASAVMLAAALAASTAAPAVDITLTPRPAAAGGAAIATIDVTLRFDGVGAAAGAARPAAAAGREQRRHGGRRWSPCRRAMRRGPLTLRAREVDLPMQAARDAESGGPSREWIADRAVAGPLTVRYTIPRAGEPAAALAPHRPSRSATMAAAPRARAMSSC
ncbi:MAG: hypothetical protein PGN08_05970 [Sphingomonas taxi]